MDSAPKPKEWLEGPDAYKGFRNCLSVCPTLCPVLIEEQRVKTDLLL